MYLLLKHVNVESNSSCLTGFMHTSAMAMGVSERNTTVSNDEGYYSNQALKEELLFHYQDKDAEICARLWAGKLLPEDIQVMSELDAILRSMESDFTILP